MTLKNTKTLKIFFKKHKKHVFNTFFKTFIQNKKCFTSMHQTTTRCRYDKQRLQQSEVIMAVLELRVFFVRLSVPLLRSLRALGRNS